MQNNIGINTVNRFQPGLQNGQPVEVDYDAATYAVSILPQITTITYTGAVPGNGIYTASITLPDGTVVVSSTAALVAPSLTDIATAVAAAINANLDLLGIASATSALGVVTIEFAGSYSGIDFTIAAGVQAGTTATLANTQTAGSTPAAGIPMARFVVRVPGTVLERDGVTNRMRLPQTGDTEAVLVGPVLRDLAQPNSGSALSTAEELVGPGKLGAVMYRGVVAVRCVRGTAAPGGAVHVQIIANGGVNPGQAAATADGGNSVQLGATRAVWLDNVAVGQIGRVRLNLIG